MNSPVAVNSSEIALASCLLKAAASALSAFPTNCEFLSGGLSSPGAPTQSESANRIEHDLVLMMRLPKLDKLVGYQVTGHGFAFQISLAYSAIVRSLENFPDAATLTIAIRVQASGSA